VWIFRGPGPHVLLVHEPIKVEMCFTTLLTILHSASCLLS